MPPFIILIMVHRLFLRKQIRLREFDYSSNGAYFITICVKNRKGVFGKIESAKIMLSDIGLLAEKYIVEIPLHFNSVEVLEYIIMPDHIHLVLALNNENSTGRETIADIVKGYKQKVSKEVHLKFPGIDFHWQRSFYDHIVRNYETLEKICEYVKHNPERLIRSKSMDNREVD